MAIIKLLKRIFVRLLYKKKERPLITSVAYESRIEFMEIQFSVRKNLAGFFLMDLLLIKSKSEKLIVQTNGERVDFNLSYVSRLREYELNVFYREFALRKFYD